MVKLRLIAHICILIGQIVTLFVLYSIDSAFVMIFHFHVLVLFAILRITKKCFSNGLILPLLADGKFSLTEILLKRPIGNHLFRLNKCSFIFSTTFFLNGKNNKSILSRFQ